MDLIRKEAEVKGEANITELLKQLASDVRPLALGSVYRAKEQIRMLSRKLLAFHMSQEEQLKIDAIVAALTRELYSHDYPIARKEAKDVLGLKIAECSEELEKVLMNLFLQYSADMLLYESYSPQLELGDKNTKTTSFDRAFIETTDRTFVFRTKREIKRTRITREGIPVDVFQERVLEEGWSATK